MGVQRFFGFDARALANCCVTENACIEVCDQWYALRCLCFARDELVLKVCLFSCVEHFPVQSGRSFCLDALESLLSSIERLPQRDFARLQTATFTTLLCMGLSAFSTSPACAAHRKTTQEYLSTHWRFFALNVRAVPSSPSHPSGGRTPVCECVRVRVLLTHSRVRRASPDALATGSTAAANVGPSRSSPRITTKPPLRCAHSYVGVSECLCVCPLTHSRVRSVEGEVSAEASTATAYVCPPSSPPPPNTTTAPARCAHSCGGNV